MTFDTELSSQPLEEIACKGRRYVPNAFTKAAPKTLRTDLTREEIEEKRILSKLEAVLKTNDVSSWGQIRARGLLPDVIQLLVLYKAFAKRLSEPKYTEPTAEEISSGNLSDEVLERATQKMASILWKEVVNYEVVDYLYQKRFCK